MGKNHDHGPYYIIYSMNTGGLLPKNCFDLAFNKIALTELSFQCVNGTTLEVVDELNIVLKPYKHNLVYSGEAQAVSGISEEYCIEHGIAIDDAIDQMNEFVEKYTHGLVKPIIIGFNSALFSIYFLINLYKYKELNIEDYFEDLFFDVMHFIKLTYPNLKTYKMKHICNLYSEEYVMGRSADKVKLITNIWVKILKSLRS